MGSGVGSGERERSILHYWTLVPCKDQSGICESLTLVFLASFHQMRSTRSWVGCSKCLLRNTCSMIQLKIDRNISSKGNSVSCQKSFFIKVRSESLMISNVIPRPLEILLRDQENEIEIPDMKSHFSQCILVKYLWKGVDVPRIHSRPTILALEWQTSM